MRPHREIGYDISAIHADPYLYDWLYVLEVQGQYPNYLALISEPKCSIQKKRGLQLRRSGNRPKLEGTKH